MKNRIFLNIKINDCSIEQVVEEVLGPSVNTNGFFRYVVTPNVDHWQRLNTEGSSEFVSAYRGAYYILCDSRVIQKVALLKGVVIKNVVPGSDLTYQLLSNDSIKTKKIVFFGPDVKDSQNVAIKFGLKNVVVHTPPMGFIKDEQVVNGYVALIAKENPDYVFLAVGSPQQEIVALRLQSYYKSIHPNKGVYAFCIGASLDFLSGKQTRAPKLVQIFHLEWFHRALTNPKKLIPRYYRNFIWLLQILLKRA